MSKYRNKPVSEFNDFKPRLNCPKNQFYLTAGLNLEKFITNLSGTNQLSRGLNLNRGSNSLNSASVLCPNLMNLSRVSNPPKTGFD